MNSIKRVIKSTLTVLFVLQISLARADVYTPFNIQYDNNFMLSLRGCFTAQLGVDYLTKVVNSMITQYITRFNDETTFTVENLSENQDTRTVANY